MKPKSKLALKSWKPTTLCLEPYFKALFFFKLWYVISVRLFDLIPRLRASPKYQLSSENFVFINHFWLCAAVVSQSQPQSKWLRPLYYKTLKQIFKRQMPNCACFVFVTETNLAKNFSWLESDLWHISFNILYLQLQTYFVSMATSWRARPCLVSTVLLSHPHKYLCQIIIFLTQIIIHKNMYIEYHLKCEDSNNQYHCTILL